MNGEKLIVGGKLVAAVGAITAVSNPVTGLVGGALLDVLSYYITKNSTDFINDIEVRLKAIEATGILDVNQLARKEGFLELLLTACTVAQRTQRKEKIQRIKKAVIYCACNPQKPESIDSFFHLFDQLAEEHFIVLQVLSDHLSEFSSVKSFSEAFTVFQQYALDFSLDTFGHYLSDLKYRRLIRLSSTIEDEEGLASQTLLAAEADHEGATIIISEIAQSLLAITK